MSETRQAPRGRAERVATLRAVLGLVVAATALHLPMLAGQIVFYRDVANWNYPARFFVRKALLEGDSPFWNPLQGFGISVAGNPLYGIFYPPNWLFLLTPERLVAAMLTWQSFAHLVWGGIGIIFLLRRFGVSGFGAFIGGCAWSLAGYTEAQWSSGLLLIANSWVPWIGLGILNLVRACDARGGRGGRAAPWAVLPVGCAFLAGEVFVGLMGVIFGIATAFVDWRERRSSMRPLDRHTLSSELQCIAPKLVAALVLGGALGAATIVPAAVAAGGTERGRALPLSRAEEASVHPLRLLEMVAPGALGTPFEDYPGALWVGEVAFSGHPLSYTISFGATLFVLVALALGRGAGQHALARGFALLAILALLIALGKHTPCHWMFRSVVRPFARMRYPEKYLVLVLSWVALLAGLGADRLVARGFAGWRRTVPLGSIALIALVLSPNLWAPAPIVSSLRSAGVLAAGLVLALVAAQRLASRKPRLGQILLCSAVLFELALAQLPIQHWAPLDLGNRKVPALDAVLSNPRTAMAPPRVYRSHGVEGTIARLAVEARPSLQAWRSMLTLVQGVPSIFGVAIFPPYDAAVPESLIAFWGDAMPNGGRALQLLSTSHAMLEVNGLAEPSGRKATLERIMEPMPGARLYRVKEPLPRVYAAGAAAILPDEAPVAPLFAQTVLRGELAYVAPDPSASGLDGPAGRAGDCSFDRFRNSELVASCRLDREALVVFVEQHAPGWTAEVDGRPAPLLRVNRVMRGVRVLPGDHLVRLTFWPPGLSLGLGLSFGALLGVIGLTLLARRTRRLWGA